MKGGDQSEAWTITVAGPGARWTGARGLLGQLLEIPGCLGRRFGRENWTHRKPAVESRHRGPVACDKDQLSRCSPWVLALLLLNSLAACGDPAGPNKPVSVAPSAAGVPSTGQQALHCAEPVFDLGEVWQGAVLEHEFVLEARTDAPGGVAFVKPDCGCAIAELEVQAPGAARQPYTLKEPLSAGTRLLVRVSYNTRDKHGPAPRSITVYGPAGAQRLRLEVFVRPWLKIDPELAQMGILEESSSTSRDFEVESLGGEPFGLEFEGYGVPDELHVELIPHSANAAGRSNHWTARVHMREGMPRGSHSYPITLHSDQPIEGSEPSAGSPRFHSVATLITVTVVGPVSLEPEGLLFGVVQPDETVARRLRLVSHVEGFSLPEPKVWLKPLEGDDEFALGKTAKLSVQRVEGQEAWDIQVLLSGLDEAVNDNFMCTLVIETGHPDQPEIQALVRGVRMP